MDLAARHTKIVEQIGTSFGTLIREDHFGYPESESNIYMLDSDGNLRWHAERPMEKDAFSNSIYDLGKTSFKCASWNGFDCEIDLHSGGLMRAVFTR